MNVMTPIFVFATLLAISVLSPLFGADTRRPETMRHRGAFLR
jgi:hypothetical protein